MKKTFSFFLGLAVVFSSFLISCENSDIEHEDNNNENENTAIYNVAVYSSDNGVAVIRDYAETSISVMGGTDITIAATPDEGYDFAGWRTEESAVPVNLGSVHTFEVSGDIALTAVFKIKPEEVQDTVYPVVEQQPEFPGGTTELMKYLSDNIIYPEISEANNSQGRAFVRFVVNADGSITDAFLLRSAGDVYLDMEALRVVSAMPNWTPGKQYGKPVRTYYTIPVTFRLR